MKTFYEAIIAQGGFAGQVFDVAQGPTNLDIISVLLSVGNGAITGNAPINMISTGALGGARSLNITATQQNGRMFFLSVRNTDITTNNLTVVATTDINGFGPNFVISSKRDFLFVHESGGTWRAYEQKLDESTTVAIFRTSFAASVWTAGVANRIRIKQTGAPGAGEIGPHNLAIASTYLVQVYRDDGGTEPESELVDLGTRVDSTNGDIVLTKTGLATAFDGHVIVSGTM